jgi:predicted transcriptional regulator
MMEAKAIVLAVHPHQAEAIFEGTKLYEYRRRMWKQRVTRLYIYAKEPVSAVIGEVVTLSTLQGTPEEIWEQTGLWAGITQRVFDRYMKGAKLCYAVCIHQTLRYSSPRTLEYLGIAKLSVPHTYIY